LIKKQIKQLGKKCKKMNQKTLFMKPPGILFNGL